MKFEERIRELVEGMPDLEEIMEPLLAARRKLRAEFARLHKKVLMTARNDATCRRLMTLPEEVARTLAIMDEDSTVYEAMNGPTEFHVIGSLKDWSIIDRLHNIAVPTLLISGRHDEATPKVVQPFADNIPNVRWTIFEESSHMPHVEERAACMEVVSAFLDELDG